MSDGSERVSHWNHLKLIQGDVDVSFVKPSTDINTHKPASLQVDGNKSKVDASACEYNLRSRKIQKL